MKKLMRNFSVARWLLRRSRLYYICFGIITFIVMYFLSAAANTIIYDRAVADGTAGMDTALLNGLYTSPLSVPEGKFYEAYPQYSYPVIDSELDGQSCTAYDIRLANIIHPVLQSGEWPTELGEGPRPAIVSADLARRYPLGSIFSGAIEMEYSSGVYSGDFAVVGILDDGGVLFRFRSDRSGLIYGNRYSHYQPHYSGILTFTTIDEYLAHPSGLTTCLYDLDGVVSSDSSAVEQFSVTTELIGSRLGNSEANKTDYLKIYTPFLLSILILWLTSLSGIAGLMQVSEGRLFEILKKTGLGGRSMKAVLFIKSAYTLPLALIAVFAAAPRFGISFIAFLFCIAVWLTYTVLMTLVSGITYRRVEVKV